METITKQNRSFIIPFTQLSRWWVVCLALSLSSILPTQAAFQDFFADREMILGDQGELEGNNVGATRELEEPDHGDQPGGASVWVSWTAEQDGIATFWTDGSSFDTLLSAYYFKSPEDTQLDKLEEAASNDDAVETDNNNGTKFFSSLIQVPTRAGTQYHIAVDGYQGAVGSIRLRWDFIAADTPPPIIVSYPDDQSAKQGDIVTLTVDMPISDELELQWRLNGESIGEDNPTLVLPDLQPENLGLYTLRIRIDKVRFETPPIEIQINSDGQTNVLARDKLFDAVKSPLTPKDDDDSPEDPEEPEPPENRQPLSNLTAPILKSPSRKTLLNRRKSSLGVTRGFNGTQIFNTLFATSDPDEPSQCGLTGGASYWFAYQAPETGNLEIDTAGSNFDTFIAAYTYTPPLTGFNGLSPLGCDNDSIAPFGADRLIFPVMKDKPYLIVIDGINGTKGIVNLNYKLNTLTELTPPTAILPPQPQNLLLGAPAVLDVQVVGTPPLNFTWFKDGVLLPNATESTLFLPQVRNEDAGTYTVHVSNSTPPELDLTIPVQVLPMPKLTFTSTQETLAFQLPYLSQKRIILEQTPALHLPWEPLLIPSLEGPNSIVISNTFLPGAAFFRIRIE